MARSNPRSANEPGFEIRDPLYTVCEGVDLTALPGLGPYGALKLVSEIGLDMRRWATEKHFVSWLAVAPRNQISGGKLLGQPVHAVAVVEQHRDLRRRGVESDAGELDRFVADLEGEVVGGEVQHRRPVSVDHRCEHLCVLLSAGHAGRCGTGRTNDQRRAKQRSEPSLGHP